ncbi:mitosis protein dim1 [Aureobasidium pullulans]|nr:mitosis protein dim1 [Aureobasidium pullulans]
MGSVVLPHLASGWHVDQAIMSEEDRLVVIRFGRDWDKDCMRQDEVLYRIADRVKNFAVIYVCDLDQVPDFNQMYELYDPMTIMFFFRNKHMMCDFGTGNNNKLNWVLEDKQELIDIIETIYRGAKKGRGLVAIYHLDASQHQARLSGFINKNQTQEEQWRHKQRMEKATILLQATTFETTKHDQRSTKRLEGNSMTWSHKRKGFSSSSSFPGWN